MRTHRSAWGPTIYVLLGTLSGVAGAQTPKPNAGDSASVSTQRQVKLSPAEQLVEADAFVARMGTTGSTIRHRLEEARAQRDIVKTLCLNDKLNQIDVATRSAQDRRTALQQAASRKDGDLANHEYAILTILRQRVEQIASEASQCVGGSELYIGETKTTKTVDANLPSEDPSAYPDNPIFSVPPVTASPFR